MLLDDEFVDTHNFEMNLDIVLSLLDLRLLSTVLGNQKKQLRFVLKRKEFELFPFVNINKITGIVSLEGKRSTSKTSV